MKASLYCAFFIFLVGLLVLPFQQVKAQTVADTTNQIVGDTMYVAYMVTGGGTRANALRDAINSDTAVGGARKDLNRVYKLKTDGFYYLLDPISNTNFPLVVVGDPNIPAGHYPPEIQMLATRPDGTTGSGQILNAGANVTFKNIYFSGAYAENNVQSAYQPILFNANNSRYIIDGCIFERSSFSLVVFGGTNCECYVTNNKFRNLEENPPTQQWSGRGISIWADQDTVVIENNTFFNIGFATFQMEGGSAKYLRYNHNTLVNVGRGIMSNSGNWWQNAYFANNLVINGWWEGEGYVDMHTSGRDPRQVYSGLFSVGTLPSTYGTEQARRVVITKTYAYLDPLILAKYGTTPSTDSITRAYFIDPVSVTDYMAPYSLSSGNGHMVIKDTSWLTSLPSGMTNYLYDANWNTLDQALASYSGTASHMVDSMWKFITQVRSGTNMYTTFFYHPTTYTTDPFVWPVPENFSYSTSDPLYTAGTDGLPIGDLNYFPTKKAAFYASQSTNVNSIESIAGQVVVDSVKSNLEAENGGLSGTSVKTNTTGLTFYDQNGGAGSLTWTFTVPPAEAGLWDTKWLVNETGRGQSGPVLAINGIPFVDRAHGWGQFVMDPLLGPAYGMSNSAWIWMNVTADSVEESAPVFGASATPAFTLAAGTNTIGVASGGWGEVQFSEIDMVMHGGTDTLKLKAPDAAPVLVTPGALGVNWVASGFKYVALGTAGVDTLSFTVANTGTYRVRIFGQNVSGSNQTLTVKEGSTTLATPALPYKLNGSVADDRGNDVLSSTFALTAGTHKITVSGANSNVDYVQIIKENVVSSVGGSQTQVPDKFALEQNYPNPFNPSTKINFSLAKVSNVKLTVYNLLGQKIATLVDNRMDAGAHSVVFDASKFASGVYFYTIDAGDFKMSKKMLLLK